MSGEEEIKCWTGEEGEDKLEERRRIRLPVGGGATSGQSWPDRQFKNAQVSVLSLGERCTDLMS